MKTMLFRFISLLCFVCSFVSCESEDEWLLTNQLPREVAKDLELRFGSVESLEDFTFGQTSPNLTCVGFTDQQLNQVSVYYVDYQWSLTITEARDFDRLPDDVKKNFFHSSYGEMSFENMRSVKCIKRKELSHVLYDFQFTYPLGEIEAMFHELLMDENGRELAVSNTGFSPECMFCALKPKQLEYIRNHYPQADILCFVNNLCADCFKILDEEILKTVAFNPLYDGWLHTSYLLPETADLPVAVVEQLDRTVPDFQYSKVYLSETPGDTLYTFIDATSVYLNAWTFCENGKLCLTTDPTTF